MAEDYSKWLEDLSNQDDPDEEKRRRREERGDDQQVTYEDPDEPTRPATTAMIERDRASWEQRLREEAAARGVEYDPSDAEGVARQVSYAANAGRDPADFINEQIAIYDRRAQPTFSAGGRGGGGGVSPMASWLGGGGGGSFNVNMPDYSKYFEQQNRALEQQNTYLGQMQESARAREAQIAQREAAQQAQRDQLYGTLMGRAQQSTNINADDPVIRGQVEAFRNEQTRGMRDYLSDVAEGAGSLANLRGEKRMAAERTGQATGGFQAQLLGRELSAKRAEIADALQSMGGMLSADQQANLTRELGNIDSQLRSVGAGFQGAGVGFGGAAAFGGLGNELQRALMQNQQFYSGLGSENERFLADLGLRAENQFNYWRDPLRGLR